MLTTNCDPIRGGQPPILPQEKSTREIVREEIQRQKTIDELEEKHKNGEISDFEYKVNMALLLLPQKEVSPKYIALHCTA